MPQFSHIFIFVNDLQYFFLNTIISVLDADIFIILKQFIINEIFFLALTKLYMPKNEHLTSYFNWVYHIIIKIQLFNFIMLLKKTKVANVQTS